MTDRAQRYRRQDRGPCDEAKQDPQPKAAPVQPSAVQVHRRDVRADIIIVAELPLLRHDMAPLDQFKAIWHVR